MECMKTGKGEASKVLAPPWDSGNYSEKRLKEKGMGDTLSQVKRVKREKKICDIG